MSLSQVVYTSVLANQHGLDAVTSIVRSARAKNPKLNVTGLLLFDGTHFCQYLEGPAANVAWLLERIRSDARHATSRCVIRPRASPSVCFRTGTLPIRTTSARIFLPCSNRLAASRPRWTPCAVW